MMDRRTFVTAAALAPVAVAAHAVAQTGSPEFEAALHSYLNAWDAYCAAPDATADDELGEAYDEALTRLSKAQPPTPQDFVHKFAAIFKDGGCIEDRALDSLLKDARRLTR
ncbi:MAG: hypothetical protein EP345_17590 [Sphingomonadales bacterium]|nr:MAG: hypothetical protein EP345_17590 [Sphingomonadales bacterium]